VRILPITVTDNEEFASRALKVIKSETYPEGAGYLFMISRNMDIKFEIVGPSYMKPLEEFYKEYAPGGEC
jgi:hypothetical protein